MGKSKKRDANKIAPSSEADAAAGGMEQLEQQQQQQPQQERHKAMSQRRTNAADEDNLTRRQKRQKLNEKNQWPQHPKIRNPEQRAKAYLRVAGIEPIPEETVEEHDDNNEEKTTTTETKTNHKHKNDMTDMSDEDWRRFGRFLGGTDQRTRHKAVQRLQAFLKAKCQPPPDEDDNNNASSFGLSELDLMKLWKGLWYTLYMADKAPVQDELAKHISKLIWSLQGTLEEDEYAAQAYLDVTTGELAEYAEDSDSDDDENEKDLDPSEVMQQIIAQYGDDEECEDDRNSTSDNNDSESSENSKDNKEDSDSDHDSDDNVQILDERFVAVDDDDDKSENSDSYNDDMEEEDEEIDDSLVPHCRGAHLASLFWRTGLVTMRREWGNMDKYRIDKFYTLLRYTLREVYTYMAIRHWNLGILRLFHDALYEEILCQRPNGMRYHILDICVEEIARVSQYEGTPLPLTEATFLDWLEPFVAVAQNGGANNEGVAGDPTVHQRVVEQVLNKYVLQHSVVAETSSKDGDKKNKKNDKAILDQVHVGTVADFIFEVAGDGSTDDCFRKSLYDVVKTYKRQLKTGQDVDLSSQQREEEEEYDKENNEEYPMMEMEEDEDEGLQQDPEEQAATTESKKKRKKKNKKSKEQQLKNEEVAPTKSAKASKTNHVEEDQDEQNKGGQPVKKRKRNKKKKNKTEERDPHEIDDGEVLTISVADQKQAKSAMKKLRQDMLEEDASPAEPEPGKKKSKKQKAREAEDERKRRVSFDRNNRARSWKASMAGLRKLKPSAMTKKSPEKGILLTPKHTPKHKVGNVNRKAQQRKRAVDYF